MSSESRQSGGQSPAQSPPTLAEALHAMGAALQSLAASLTQGQPVPSRPPLSLAPATPTDPVGLVRAVNEFLTYQARLSRSDRYLRQLRVVFGSLTLGRSGLMVHELTPADVRQEEGIIVVPARVAKTRRRRVVAISPNLREWLALGGTLRGMRPDTIRQVMRTAGVACPPNVSRHSWCSHHLALHESAARTALEAGHAEAVLFGHYRALVTRAQAVAYFGLAPSGARGSTARSPAGMVMP